MQDSKGIGVEVMGASKYFWLRMNKDFFKRHDIRIIESMPNGKDYILFYLKLLCESVDHEGNLRFSEIIPYNEEMLSTITNTNVDIVRSAIKCFTSLNMMELLDDGTYFMTEVSKMIGSSVQDDHARESTRLRVQAYRERQKQLEQSEKRYSNVTCNGKIDIELEKDIEIDNNKYLGQKTCEDTSKKEELFESFWKSYPRKVGKEKCRNWFKSHKPKEDLVKQMIEAVEQQKKSKQWSDPQYIPHPYTWLNQGRWEDELTPTKDSTFQSAPKNPIQWEEAKANTIEDDINLIKNNPDKAHQLLDGIEKINPERANEIRKRLRM